MAESAHSSEAGAHEFCRCLAPSMERRFSNMAALCGMELMDEGMDQLDCLEASSSRLRRVRESLKGRTRIVLPGRSRDVSSGPIFLAVESDQDWGEVRLDAITEHTESMLH